VNSAAGELRSMVAVPVAAGVAGVPVAAGTPSPGIA
jgi:hypothetical protein